MSLDTAYREVLAADSDIRDHLPTFANLVTILEAKTVIELGVRNGTSTIAWLHGLSHTDGRLWSVDPGPPPVHHTRLTYLQGLDTDPGILTLLPNQADVVFVDTDHTYELTQREILLYAPRVAPGGCIVFHDTAVETFPHHEAPGYEPQPPYPVRRAVTEAAMSQGWAVDWTERCSGLAVCWPGATQ